MKRAKAAAQEEIDAESLLRRDTDLIKNSRRQPKKKAEKKATSVDTRNFKGGGGSAHKRSKHHTSGHCGTSNSPSSNPNSETNAPQ